MSPYTALLAKAGEEEDDYARYADAIITSALDAALLL